MAHGEIPKRSADIDHARDAATNVARENIVEVRLDPRDFVFVGANVVQIGDVWSREQIGRLKEVNVGVDVTGQNEFAFAINLSGVRRQGFRANCRDAIAIDHERAVHVRLPNFNLGARTNQRRVSKRNFFRTSRDRADEEKYTNSRFHTPSVVAVLILKHGITKQALDTSASTTLD